MGAHSAPPDTLAVSRPLCLKGPISKGRENGSGGEGRVFSLYLSICGFRKGPGKFLMGVLESPGFFISKPCTVLVMKPTERCRCRMQRHAAVVGYCSSVCDGKTV